MKFLLIILSISTLLTSTKYISSINFNGNSIDKNQLLSIIKHRNPTLFTRSELNQKLLSIDAMLIESYYKSVGFINAKVNTELLSLDDVNVSINFIINEGLRHKINEISFTGNSFFSDSILKVILTENLKDYYEAPIISSNIDKIYLEYQRNGMIYASILPKESINNGIVDLEIDIIEGEVFNVGEINIITNSKQKYILRELEFTKNDKYNIDNFNLSRKQIYGTRLFSSIDISHVVNKHDSSYVDITIKTKRMKPILREIDFGLSQLSTTKNDIIKPAFSSQLKWRNNNIFNSSYQLGINGDIGINYFGLNRDEEDKYLFFRIYSNVDFQGKWIWKYRIPFRLIYFIEYISDNDQISRFGTRADFTILKRNNIKSVASFTNEYFEGSNNDFIEVMLDYNDIDNFLNPTRGLSFRINPSLHGIVYSGDYRYFKLFSDFRKYFSINSVTTLAMRFQYGAIFELYQSNSSNDLTSDPIPSYDLFYIGGQPSLRGWSSITDFCGYDCSIEDAGDKFKILFNIELRHKIYKNIGFQVFFDGGEISSKNNFFNNFSWNIGYGLSYMTPVGPVTINIGYPYANNNPAAHLSFLYMF